MEVDFKCDVCNKILDIYYFNNHWIKIDCEYKKCCSTDDSFKFGKVICSDCWNKLFPKMDLENSKNYECAKEISTIKYLDRLGV